MTPFDASPALWNRTSADLASDEVLAQLLDWGTREDWRIAAMASLGEPVDWNQPVAVDRGI